VRQRETEREKEREGERETEREREREREREKKREKERERERGWLDGWEATNISLRTRRRRRRRIVPTLTLANNRKRDTAITLEIAITSSTNITLIINMILSCKYMIASCRGRDVQLKCPAKVNKADVIYTVLKM
jgi:hypothetical protein